jgi:DNA-binding GntR family transcriptional regulator
MRRSCEGRWFSVNWTATPNWQRIAEVLEEEIVSGAYIPGQQIKQGRICKRFDVSVATVREALRHLESAGLLFLSPNRGVFVASVSTEELLGVLLPTRLTLEKFAIEHTLARMTTARWQELRLRVSAMEAGAETNDLPTINEADIKFHKATVLWSEQPHTIQLWRSVEPRTRAQMYRLAPHHRDMSEVAREHAYLLEQFRTGSPALIAAALEDHIVTSARGLLGQDTDGQVPSSSLSATAPQRAQSGRDSS